MKLEIDRGGKRLTPEILVQDLHAVTPNSFIELSGATLHALSYQQARNNQAALGQVLSNILTACSGRAVAQNRDT